jgi:hypothetical protein
MKDSCVSHVVDTPEELCMILSVNSDYFLKQH